MRKVLFVDDEPRVLEALLRAMRPYRQRWQSHSAVGGRAALEALAATPYDIIVTDMRMPEMDGAELLTRVQRSHPDVVRIVLSGHTEAASVLQAMRVTQQFLTKPCDGETLRGVIERACGLRDLLHDVRLRDVVGELERLPASSVVYRQLHDALSRQDVSLCEIAKLIERDMAMCAKVLQLVNSAFFGLGRRVTSVEIAVKCLGTTMLQSLVFSLEIFGSVGASTALPEAEIAAMQAHCLSVAWLVRRMVPEGSGAADAYTAAMLHEIGQLVLAARRPVEFAAVISRARETAKPVEVAEAELGYSPHAHVGAYLLGVWGLPMAVVEAVAQHHDVPAVPPVGQPAVFGVVEALRTAQALVDLCEHPAPDVRPPPPCLANDYLLALGVADRLPRWLEFARERHERRGGQ